MKIILTAFLVIFFLACQEKKLGVPAKVEVTQGISSIYSIDKSASNAQFQFSFDAEPISFNTPISSGRFSILDGLLTTGDFELDMLDWKNATPKTKTPFLLDSLKSSSAFDVENFQNIRATINKVELKTDNLGNTHLLSCEIKVKNIVIPISIPAQIILNNNQINFQTNDILFPIEEFAILNKYNKKTGKFRLQIKASKVEQ